MKNRFQPAPDANDLNQHSDIPGLMTPAYDEDGNTTTTELRDAGATYTVTFTWDAENRLLTGAEE